MGKLLWFLGHREIDCCDRHALRQFSTTSSTGTPKPAGGGEAPHDEADLAGPRQELPQHAADLLRLARGRGRGVASPVEHTAPSASSGR
uniref:Uncharacterized protein n=1 Tax=uncultured Armatimonadetes bacterium TaxID=157466 RepID=A0A6J4HQJ5_9BACT|nr:hypothetical protein AVDCRST_MAG63-878 [uncultured Armatimonadetes bacterium]